jgi:malonyl-CoA O-methyltransferase
VQAGLQDPVLDVDRLSVRYRGAGALFRDLTAAGARNALCDRQRGLMGRSRFGRFTDALFATDNECTLTLELVYGHCWGSGIRRSGTSITVDASKIPLRRQ